MGEGNLALARSFPGEGPDFATCGVSHRVHIAPLEGCVSGKAEMSSMQRCQRIAANGTSSAVNRFCSGYRTASLRQSTCGPADGGGVFCWSSEKGGTFDDGGGGFFYSCPRGGLCLLRRRTM